MSNEGSDAISVIPGPPELIDQGRIRLDDRLDRFFPEVPNANIITIRSLLNMTAGIYDFFYQDPAVQWDYLHRPLKKWDREELYRILISHKPAYPPGERCVYSNANYFHHKLILMLQQMVLLKE